MQAVRSTCLLAGLHKYFFQHDVKNLLGKMVIGDQECLEGAMSNETRQKLERCKGKMAVVMEETTTSTSDAICESRTRAGDKKVVCIDYIWN